MVHGAYPGAVWGLASPGLLTSVPGDGLPWSLSCGGAARSANTFSTRENSWHAQKRLLLCSITNPCRRRQISLFDATPHLFSVRSESPDGRYSSSFEPEVVRLILYWILNLLVILWDGFKLTNWRANTVSLFLHNLSSTWLTFRSALRSLAKLAALVS